MKTTDAGHGKNNMFLYIVADFGCVRKIISLFCENIIVHITESQRKTD